MVWHFFSAHFKLRNEDMNSERSTANRGFTLIELLVVI
ncbi:MAG: hypothetical protein DME26_05905, partial [Verrucomicrobia bacterium]